MNVLAGKVAVVTGGTSGIGYASAKRFAEESARVFITGRRREALEEAVISIGHDAVGVQGDVADLDDLDRLYREVGTVAGRLDVVFANAGAAIGAAIGQITEAQFDTVVGVNMRGTLFTVQKALPLLAEGGSVIMTGSIAGVKGRPGRSVYNASKAALRSFARSWASDLKDRAIRVNLLTAGPTDTGSFRGASAETKAKLGAQTLRGTLGRPEEVADVALFLASDLSRFVNGTELFADGGAAQV